MNTPDRLATFGPFFVIRVHARPPGGPWRPMSELVTDPAALGARMGQVRGALGAGRAANGIEDRVVASVTQLGLTARLVAPLLGLAVLGAAGPVVDLADVHWQATLGGPFPVSLPDYLLHPEPVQPGRRSGDDTALLAFLEGPVRALADATRALVPVAPQVLWGNVASTVHAAGEMARSARPDLGARAATVTDAALAHPLLRAEHQRERGFRRRSCCLMYRVAAPVRPRSVCGDCVLTA